MIGKNQDPSIGKNTQFKPGESGNPDGKPPGTLIVIHSFYLYKMKNLE